MLTAPVKTVSELFGAPPLPQTGKERLVAAALELFARRGYGAVGVDQIIAQAGVTKTTFYKHFQGKDDLTVMAVETLHVWESNAWARAVHQMAGDDPAAQLMAFVDVMDLWFNEPEFRGCMFLNAAAEFPNPHDPVHEAAAGHMRQTRDHFRNLARSAGAPEPDAERFADCYMVLIEGALVMRQAQQRNDAARIVRPMVEQLIKSLIPRGRIRAA